MNTNQKLPSDALSSRPRPVRTALITLAAVVVIAAGGTGAYAFNQAQTAASTPTPTSTPYVATLTPEELDSVQSGAEQQAAIITAQVAAEKAAADAAAAQAAMAAAHQQQDGDGPIKCAYGYTANAVDGNGNESNCQKNGPGNKPCVAYNDANQCTAYLEG